MPAPNPAADNITPLRQSLVMEHGCGFGKMGQGGARQRNQTVLNHGWTWIFKDFRLACLLVGLGVIGSDWV
jgi:hypothetical protein